MAKKTARKRARRVLAPEDRVAIRRAKAIKLREQGYTFREIALKCNVSPKTAVKDVKFCLDELAEARKGYAENVRDEEGQRLDFMWKQLQKGLTSKTISIRTSAVKAGVALSERRSRLYGLDKRYEKAAERTDIQVVMHIPAAGNPAGRQGLTIDTAPGHIPALPAAMQQEERVAITNGRPEEE